MKKDQEPKSNRRRDFLKLAGLGTLAGATVAAGVPKTAEAASATQGAKKGYQETEHVKTFYRLARF